MSSDESTESKVQPIRPGLKTAAPSQVSRELIAFLEEVLEMARTGKITGAAIMGIDGNHTQFMTKIVGEVPAVQLLGMFEVAKADILGKFMTTVTRHE